MIEAQVQFPKESLELTLSEIEQFFESKNVVYDVVREDHVVMIEFNEPVNLTREEYNDLYDLLGSLGFFNINGAESQVNDFIGYKSWIGIDEFENDDGIRVVIYYIKEIMKGEVKFFIKEIEVRVIAREGNDITF